MPWTSFAALALVKAWSAMACWRHSTSASCPRPSAAACRAESVISFRTKLGTTIKRDPLQTRTWFPRSAKTGSPRPVGLFRFSEALTVVMNCSWECSCGTSRRSSLTSLGIGRAAASVVRATKERMKLVFMIVERVKIVMDRKSSV